MFTFVTLVYSFPSFYVLYHYCYISLSFDIPTILKQIIVINHWNDTILNTSFKRMIPELVLKLFDFKVLSQSQFGIFNFEN